MEKAETREKPCNVFRSNFVIRAAPLCVGAEIALIVAERRCAPIAFWRFFLPFFI